MEGVIRWYVNVGENFVISAEKIGLVNSLNAKILRNFSNMK